MVNEPPSLNKSIYVCSIQSFFDQEQLSVHTTSCLAFYLVVVVILDKSEFRLTDRKMVIIIFRYLPSLDLREFMFPLRLRLMTKLALTRCLLLVILLAPLCLLFIQQ